MVPGYVEAGGLAGAPPEMLAGSEPPVYTKVVLLICVASAEGLLRARHSESSCTATSLGKINRQV